MNHIRMTNREAYSYIKNFLLGQGKMSSENGICRYRGFDGTKCAVGCLIPDNLYSSDMEDLGVEKVLQKFPKLKKYLAGISVEMLMEMQAIHDTMSETYSEDEFNTRLSKQCFELEKKMVF